MEKERGVEGGERSGIKESRRRKREEERRSRDGEAYVKFDY